MNQEQIAEEIRALSDRLDRAEASIDQAYMELRTATERTLPAAVAQVSHTVTGALEIIANVSGTQAKLAAQIASIADRVSLIERTTE